MGLDIYLSANNEEALFTADYYDEAHDYMNKHNLSRTFCNLICRRNVVEHLPELDQIGKITGIDISPIYEMEGYPDEEELEFELEFAETENQKAEILRNIEIEKEKLKGNLNRVLETVNLLIQNLERQENIYPQLIQTNFDSLNSEYYFSNLKFDTKDRLTPNNLGQDLRNFRRFLEFAKERGSDTVWFNYG